MDRKMWLWLYQILSLVFTLVVIILFVLAVYSSFLNPLMNQAMFVELPAEEDIEWSIEDESLHIRADIWIENDGYYELQDINIDFELFGLNETLYHDVIQVDRLATGDRSIIPVSFSIHQDDFDQQQIEEFTFNTSDFKISSHMTARYPFSLMDLEMFYEDFIQWDGLVQQLEFVYEEASVRSLPDQDGSVLELPFVVETNDILTGNAEVEITMYDGTMTNEYSTCTFSVPLGTHQWELLSFQLDEEDTDEFITRSQNVIFVSDISLVESGIDIEYTSDYSWGAPLNQLSVDNIRRVDEDRVRADISFENDSPRTLLLDIEIIVYDEDDIPVGVYQRQRTVPSGEYFEEVILINLESDPLYAEVSFFDQNTEMEYDTVVDVHDV